ncbi:hypothetical protein FNV43_RR04215 [Rhamnella rubrinervis]|uniref:Uncharacterized protein n=1 Tax=Rhamnella rubrinervis TaxID=2594499 RepID=A0A8K0HKA1_9ROSA|nr:hypothetical protein FNV43_RR04215 [Rhamnella rubrinervis]
MFQARSCSRPHKPLERPQEVAWSRTGSVAAAVRKLPGGQEAWLKGRTQVVLEDRRKMPEAVGSCRKAARNRGRSQGKAVGSRVGDRRKSCLRPKLPGKAVDAGSEYRGGRRSGHGLPGGRTAWWSRKSMLPQRFARRPKMPAALQAVQVAVKLPEVRRSYHWAAGSRGSCRTVREVAMRPWQVAWRPWQEVSLVAARVGEVIGKVLAGRRKPGCRPGSCLRPAVVAGPHGSWLRSRKSEVRGSWRRSEEVVVEGPQGRCGGAGKLSEVREDDGRPGGAWRVRGKLPEFQKDVGRPQDVSRGRRRMPGGRREDIRRSRENCLAHRGKLAPRPGRLEAVREDAPEVREGSCLGRGKLQVRGRCLSRRKLAIAGCCGVRGR